MITADASSATASVASSETQFQRSSAASPMLSTIDVTALLETPKEFVYAGENATTGSKTPISSSKSTAKHDTPKTSKESTVVCKRKPWPQEYQLPMMTMSIETRNALERNEDLRKPSLRYQRGMFLRAIVCDVIENYTLYPDADQKRDIARSIVKTFPHLKEENSVAGCAAWLASLVDAFKNRRRDLKGCAEVALRATMKNETKKREIDKDESSTSKQSGALNKKKIICDEEDTSANHTESNEIDDEIAEMKRIMTYVERDRDVSRLKVLMKTTYSARRTMLKEGCSLSEMSLKFPALFTADGLIDEFQEVCKKTNILKSVKNKLDSFAQAIISMAKRSVKRRLKSAPQLEHVLEEFASQVNDASDSTSAQSARVAALLLLPFLLAEDADLLYKEYNVSFIYCYFLFL